MSYIDDDRLRSSFKLAFFAYNLFVVVVIDARQRHRARATFPSDFFVFTFSTLPSLASFLCAFKRCSGWGNNTTISAVGGVYTLMWSEKVYRTLVQFDSKRVETWQHLPLTTLDEETDLGA